METVRRPVICDTRIKPNEKTEFKNIVEEESTDESCEEASDINTWQIQTTKCTTIFQKNPLVNSFKLKRDKANKWTIEAWSVTGDISKKFLESTAIWCDCWFQTGQWKAYL